MNVSRRRAIVVTGLMLGTAAFAQLAKPTVRLGDRFGKPDLDQLFPRAFGNWREDTAMPVVLPSPDVQSKLNSIYNQVLSRTYVNPAGQRIMLSVAYGGDQSDGTRLHRPEVCYPAQGFQIVSNQRATMNLPGRTIGVRQLMSRLGARQEPITYWIVVGGAVVTSGSEQKWIELKYGLKGLIPDGMLVRVSSIDQDPNRGYALQQSFIVDLATGLDPAQRSRVFGDPAMSA
jgi:EpsI family protein